MSDQVSQEFNTQFAGGGGGGGLISINGDVTPAQLIVASTGIIVGNAGATHSIANDGVTTFQKSGSPARKGAITLAGSASVTVTEGPNGTYTLTAAPAGGALLSINGDTTPAQILAAGVGITITPGPPGTNTIAATGAGLGVVSINADITAAQILESAVNAGVEILDTGAGHHTFKTPTSFRLANGGAPGLALPNGVLTVVTGPITIPAAQGGFWFIEYHAGLNGIAGQIMDAGLRKNGVFQVGSGFSGVVEIAGQTCAVNGHCGPLQVSAPGDVWELVIDHHGGGAATTTITCTIDAFRLSG